ncbi:hypothetical protein FISHEDRAFT_72196 [Fistulina hepatica ATCC 64428]|uniref:S-adenosyl-L-methionine-dependent methyltransferase n=1 Tax=Fistulina hepatica ATCC 64428 TaxID=1128425 RepID=A0A0D7AFS6_9AGAR|nr:hypothetical protein FISHEDRAFT_72196 [Fistulina hepatica ATCC 64428]
MRAAVLHELQSRSKLDMSLDSLDFVHDVQEVVSSFPNVGTPYDDRHLLNGSVSHAEAHRFCVRENYQLPTNNTEMDRLNTQHRLATLLIDGLYPAYCRCIVEELLQPREDGSHPCILDVGCGPATWYENIAFIPVRAPLFNKQNRAMEMARRFPSADVVGLDLTQQEYNSPPDNFRFVQGDLNADMSPFHGRFAIVHCRFVAQHFPEPFRLPSILADCGLLLMADGDWVIFDKDKNVIPPLRYDATADEATQAADAQPGSWLAGWFDIFRGLTRAPDYQTPEVLIEESRLFKNIRFNHILAPINWAGDDGAERDEKIGVTMAANARDFFRNGVPAVLKMGMSPRMVELWRQGVEDDLNHQLCSIWHFATARKL